MNPTDRIPFLKHVTSLDRLTATALSLASRDLNSVTPSKRFRSAAAVFAVNHSTAKPATVIEAS